MTEINLRDASDTLLVGGKAAWLGKLLRADINVPNGFVVAATAIFPLNNRTKTEILTKFDLLNTKKVAVRSSGADEDGAEKSFAGQFDTFLNVERGDLMNKITEVHNSAHNARVASYAGKSETKLAIVVQEMVAAEISGVAFSANVVTGNRDEIVVEAVRGLGEKLVSGQITPDLFIINKNSGEILTHEIGDEKINLSPKNLNEIVDFVIKIEQLAGQPMDIEWALCNNKIYILQARPITTLSEEEK